MTTGTIGFLRRSLIGLAVLLVVVLVWRAWYATQPPHLERWHTFVPDEPSAGQIDDLDWPGYLAIEDQLFEQVRTEVSEKLEAPARIESNRYYPGSPLYPERFATDWNRSYILLPEGRPIGAVVLLHGLTDSPYSLRHIARRYAGRGYAAVAIRLPGHGTVPAGLAEVDWEQWMAATRLAAREARRLAPAPAPRGAPTPAPRGTAHRARTCRRSLPRAGSSGILRRIVGGEPMVRPRGRRPAISTGRSGGA